MPTSGPFVRLTVRHASYLLEHALNSLGGPPHVRSAVHRRYGVDIARDSTAVVVATESEPCCSHCCAPCVAITELARTPKLDVILGPRGPGHEWWNDAGGHFDRAWMAERIRPYCEAGLSSDPNRCTDYGPEFTRCARLGPRSCRERPEHEACRAERVCDFDLDHDGPHTWEVAL